MREILHEAAERDPQLLFDIIERRDKRLRERTPEPQPSRTNMPDWCICTFCRDMPTEEERVCCGKQPELCISRLAVCSLHVNNIFEHNLLEMV